MRYLTRLDYQRRNRKENFEMSCVISCVTRITHSTREIRREKFYGVFQLAMKKRKLRNVLRNGLVAVFVFFLTLPAFLNSYRVQLFLVRTFREISDLLVAHVFQLPLNLLDNHQVSDVVVLLPA